MIVVNFRKQPNCLNGLSCYTQDDEIIWSFIQKGEFKLAEIAVRVQGRQVVTGLIAEDIALCMSSPKDRHGGM